jgi:UDP-glucose 4-epimerase
LTLNPLTQTGGHYLVTGGAGFVGSHLVDRLIGAGHDVTVLDDLSTGSRDNVNPKARLIAGDVRDADKLAGLIAEAQGCFHLAAIASVQQCNKSWSDSHAVNLTAYVRLLECVGRRKGGVIPVVYASSAAIYGDTSTFPVHEDLPPRPISVYGADKAGGELHAHAAGRMRGIPTFGLRPFNIYGPRQQPGSPYSGVITVFAEQLKRDAPLTIFGDGKQTRDFIYVGDVVTHFMAAMGKTSAEAPICNVATGKETSVLDLAHKLCATFGRAPNINFAAARPGDILRSVADTYRALTLLGCKAETPMEQGLSFLRGAESA